MFAIFNFANIVYVWFFIKETNGRSLEEMEVVFGTTDRIPSREDQLPVHEARDDIDTIKAPANSTIPK